MTKDEQKIEAIRLRAEGLTYQAIGQRLGVSKTTVRHRLKPKAEKLARDTNRRWWKEKRFNSALVNSRRDAKKCGHIACDATVEQLEAAFTGVCDICGANETDCCRRLCMDHCHITGKFRGFLCHNCNLGIDKLKDHLDKAASYLLATK